MAARESLDGGRAGMSLLQRLLQINLILVLLICLPALVGFAMLYSAAGGEMEPWAARQIIRFGFGLVIMFGVALVDIRFWLKSAYFIYAGAFALLIGVELIGDAAMGAQRWVNIGPLQLQPSEIMKIAMIIALARYFHSVAIEDIKRISVLIPPLVLILAPAALVLRQPDLGTAGLLAVSGTMMLFLAGLRLWKLGVAFAGLLGAIPVAWQFLREYQKTRILTFINPESDPLGAGYHILQSKIAFGSGGIFGKGFLAGTQSRLNFLPEKQTDFIFTMLAEEFGLAGGIALLLLYFALIAYASVISLRCNSQFGRMLGMGIVTTFFLYVFINMAMVMGLVPIVGVPLPLISYGGSAMLTLLFGFGLVLNIYIHRDVQIGRRQHHIRA
ncbi:MAG: rod shape-determining protein RodA [Alphaproteobacteria bacterium]|jgi:rod shape determining protein RodA|nr:rod shape-determining protein RodA [Alphaproteobacteria bacterium]